MTVSLPDVHVWSPSRPGEFHPEPLTDPDLSLSAHPARATLGKLPPSARTGRFLLLPVDQIDPDASDPPPSLHGHYAVSSVLRGSPPLTGASVLSASRGHRLRLFPYHRQPGSQVPYESPNEFHAACTPDTAWPVRRLPPRSSQGRDTPRFRCHLRHFDASSAVRLRSSLSSIHDAVFPAPFDRNVHHRGF
jgi:hypothetical protein